jgi:DNA-binding NarL/FixJ family response regulator
MTQPDELHGDGFPGTGPADLGPSQMLLDRRQWSYLSRRYDLTPREVQIAELVCQGLRHGSIAGRLSIQPGTVKTHIRNIYRKVKVRNKMNMLLRFVSEAREAAGGLNQP